MRAITVIDGNSIFKLPNFFESDEGTTITFYIKNDAGSTYDLTNFTGSFICRKVGANSNKVDASLTISSATSGICSYSFISANLNDPGLYDMYVEFIGSSRSFTIPIGRFRVKESY